MLLWRLPVRFALLGLMSVFSAGLSGCGASPAPDAKTPNATAGASATGNQGASANTLPSGWPAQQPSVPQQQPAYPQQGANPQAGAQQQTPYPQQPYPQGAYPQQPYPQGAYPQGAYPQQPYPQGAYPQQPYPQGAYPQGAYPQGGYPAYPPGYVPPGYYPYPNPGMAPTPYYGPPGTYGTPPPPAKQVNVKAVVSGSITLGIAWSISSIAAVAILDGADGRPTGIEPLFIPVIGPFIAAGTTGAFDAQNNAAELGILLIADGLIQAGGLISIITGAAGRSDAGNWIGKHPAVPEVQVGMGRGRLIWQF
ncbi:MAG: hypothetical protein IPK82_40415 [Polyangiaceae bacterium]|nr:hypothetical protein [Polyangiaceae bacterium]